MRRLVVTYALIVGALFSVWQASAQLSVTGVGGGFGGAAAPPPYIGPGDQITGAYVYFTLRAYSSATMGNKLVNACNSTGGTDVACADLFSSASTGALVPATIGGITCPGANCTVKTAYDVSGGTNCNGHACDVTQATIATRPLLVANCINSLPCMTGSGSQYLCSANIYFPSTSQPFSSTAVSYRTSGSGIFGTIIGESAGYPDMMNWTGDAQPSLYDGNVVTGSATDNQFHSLQGIWNTASSAIYVDGSSSATGALAGTNIQGTDICLFNGIGVLTGKIVEAGLISTLSGGQITALTNNQTTYWGPF